MSVSDPIADFLTRIRNASRVHHERLDVPASRLREEITRLLVREGYVADYKRIADSRQDVLRIYLRYDREDGTSVIEGLQRVSSPGLRRYVGATEIPRVRGGLGVAVVSTSEGLMTGVQARKKNLGGELICYIW